MECAGERELARITRLLIAADEAFVVWSVEQWNKRRGATPEEDESLGGTP